jgi:hypothetical protein
MRSRAYREPATIRLTNRGSADVKAGKHTGAAAVSLDAEKSAFQSYLEHGVGSIGGPA